MRNAQRFVTSAIVAGTLFGYSAGALACFNPPPPDPPPTDPPPPPRLWVERHEVVQDPTGGPAMVQYWVGLEGNVFTPDTTTTCQCGIGFQGPQVNGLQVHDVMIAVANPSTGKNESIAAFDPLARDPSLDPDLGTLEPDFDWFGFSGQIDPFEVPQLGDGDVFKIWFDIWVPLDQEELFLDQNVLVAGGAVGVPDHQLAFGTALDPLIRNGGRHIPEPMTYALAGLAVLTLGAKVRRRRLAG